MEDERVRGGKKGQKANHRKMNGVSVPIDEKFDLGRGIKTMCPGSSGDAANDINCRCFLVHELKDMTGKLKAKPDSEKVKTSKNVENQLPNEEESVIIDNKDTEMLNRKIERKSANTGSFSSLEVPMQKKSVLNVCKKYSIDTKGITFKIQRSEDLLSTVFCGMTDPDNIGRIDLLPNAFKTEAELTKTILHEKCHVMQLRKYGKKYTQEHLAQMEKQAYRFEDIFYNIVKKRR